jgi:metal transporter CNNM
LSATNLLVGVVSIVGCGLKQNRDVVTKLRQPSSLCAWIIITAPDGDPQLLLDADAYLRAALLNIESVDGCPFCHRPIIVRDRNTPLGDIILKMRHGMDSKSNQVIDLDIVPLWTAAEKRVITGADIPG